MKLSKTETRVLAEKFQNDLKKSHEKSNLKKWILSEEGKNIQKLVLRKTTIRAELEQIDRTLNKIKNFPPYSIDLAYIHNRITAPKVPTYDAIEKSIILAGIDSKCLEDILQKLKSEFKIK